MCQDYLLRADRACSKEWSALSAMMPAFGERAEPELVSAVRRQMNFYEEVVQFAQNPSGQSFDSLERVLLSYRDQCRIAIDEVQQLQALYDGATKLKETCALSDRLPLKSWKALLLKFRSASPLQMQEVSLMESIIAKAQSFEKEMKGLQKSRNEEQLQQMIKRY